MDLLMRDKSDSVSWNREKQFAIYKRANVIIDRKMFSLIQISDELLYRSRFDFTLILKELDIPVSQYLLHVAVNELDSLTSTMKSRMVRIVNPEVGYKPI